MASLHRKAFMASAQPLGAHLHLRLGVLGSWTPELLGSWALGLRPI